MTIIIIHNTKTNNKDFQFPHAKVNSRLKHHQKGDKIIVNHNSKKYCYYITNVNTEYKLNLDKSIEKETITYYCLPVDI